MQEPIVLDKNGVLQDWTWLRTKYGNVDYLVAEQYPKFQLIKVEEMEGPQTLIVNVEAENGTPFTAQPVVLSWPSLAQPSGDLPAIPAGSKSSYTSRGVIQWTENGCTGYGLGGGSYIREPAAGGPYSVFVLSPSAYSDCLTRTGWLGGTNHMGPCRMTFRLMTSSGTPDPDPEPEPEPEPDPESDVNLRIEALLKRLVVHLGA